MSNLDVNARNPAVWMWIVGLVVVAVLVWALLEMFAATRGPVPITSADTVIDTVRTAPLPSIPSIASDATPDTVPAAAPTGATDSLPAAAETGGN